MTAPTRRQVWLLAALALVAVALVVLRQPAATDVAPTRAATGSPTLQQGSPVADLRLESLESRPDDRVTRDRNLFRFESRRAAEAGPRIARGRAAPPPPPPGPPPPVLPPPPPPIPLRFIGYLDQEGSVPRVAVLSDGRGNVFSGKEGDIIEGRYRVLRIGTDSADLIYVDGRGRQTIRLSGQ